MLDGDQTKGTGSDVRIAVGISLGFSPLEERVVFCY
jgi:hypothetical protein